MELDLVLQLDYQQLADILPHIYTARENNNVVNQQNMVPLEQLEMEAVYDRKTHIILHILNRKKKNFTYIVYDTNINNTGSIDR